MVTVLTDAGTIEVPAGRVEGERLWLSEAELENATGWSSRREGLCRSGVCVPIPPGRERDFLRDGQVEAIAKLYPERERLVLAIAPEGTRARADHWKSGFYQIARRARVPIVPAYLDYGTRTAGFGTPFVPSASLRADMDRLRAVYAGKRGLYRDGFGPVRLLEEDAAPQQVAAGGSLR